MASLRKSEISLSLLKGGQAQDTDVKRIFKGLGFYALWLLLGGVVTAWTTDYLMMASLGGVFDPPAIWSLSRDLALAVLPILLLSGGAPAAIQIARGRPWKKAAKVALAICATVWLTLMFVIFFGPSVFGWKW